MAEPIDNTLSELVNLLKPLPIDANLEEYVYYLLLLWASFQVYQLEPYVASGDGGESGGGAKIIPLGNGRVIADYGYYLSTSPGEDYGNYSTGKLINAAKKMIDMLVKRGAVKVAFLGHPIAQRAAWIECLAHGLEVTNFDANEMDYLVRERVKQLRDYMERHRKEVAQDLTRPT